MPSSPPVPTTPGRDGARLFAARILRMFAYGFLSVVLVLHLVALGFHEGRIGLLLTLTLAGDAVISLALTLHADRLGRKRMLLLGAGLMGLAGLPFALSGSFWVLLVTATLGVISPSGNEVGPFLALEQAALAQVVPEARRTATFAWYALSGSFATAGGALAGGGVAQLLQAAGWTPLASYRALLLAYAAAGFLLGAVFLRLSPAIEAAPAPVASRFGLHRSRGVVARLSGLFALDAFAGGLVIQSFLAYWFHRRFGAAPATLGAIFFAANLLAGLSSLYAVRLAGRIGLIRTMVVTHIPSNVLLLLVPLMPTLPLAIAMLLLRFSISQMDVPTRQAYLMQAVAPDERSAAAGITGIARTAGASLSPVLAGALLAVPGLGAAPFLLAGGLKIAYDLLLYQGFRASEKRFRQSTQFRVKPRGSARAQRADSERSGALSPGHRRSRQRSRGRWGDDWILKAGSPGDGKDGESLHGKALWARSARHLETRMEGGALARGLD